MTNLQDYVRWRGDITFADSPFTIVDNLVLSALAYVDLGGIVPAPGHGAVSVREAARGAADPARSWDADAARRLTIVPGSLLADLGASRRFGEALLADYVDLIDSDGGAQFAAVTVHLGDGTTYVAFRGTDNTIMGWREDFAMSFEIVPAQMLASSYLRDVADRTVAPMRVGGHSKGGNLALHSVMNLPPRAQDRVVAVHNNDGPGLSPELGKAGDLTRVADRVVTIVPRFAIIGLLFQGDADVLVVDSSARGLMQHDIMSWQVEGTGLCALPAIAPAAVVIGHGIDSWLEEASQDDRREFTDAFFAALSAGGAKLTSDISMTDHGSFESVLFALARSRRRTRRTSRLAVRAAVRAVREVNFRELVRRRATLRAEAMAFVGLVLLCVPGYSVQILASFAVLILATWGTVRFARYVHRFRRQHGVRWWHVALQATLLLALLTALTRTDALVVPTNLLLGIAFLVNGWTTSKRALVMLHRPPRHRGRGRWLLVSAVVSSLFGIVALSTAGEVLHLFVMQAGQYLVVVGAVELFLMARGSAIRRYRYSEGSAYGLRH